MSAGDHHNALTIDEVVHSIRKPEEMRSADIVQDHWKLPRIALDLGQGGASGTGKLKPQAGAPGLIPLKRLAQIGLSRRLQKQTRRHPPRRSMSSRASPQGCPGSPSCRYSSLRRRSSSASSLSSGTADGSRLSQSSSASWMRSSGVRCEKSKRGELTRRNLPPASCTGNRWPSEA